jgi:RsiW-degrading membrane proteinase PrsW (M82 family)
MTVQTAPPAGIPAAAPNVPSPPPAPPRWGFQASFVQRRQPAFWLFVILLGITALINLQEQFALLGAFPTAWVFSWLLLAIWVVPVIVAIVLLDQFEREPATIMVAAFLWGAVVATGLAVIVNTAWFQILFKLFGAQFVQSWGPALIGPTVEETIKYLGLIVIYLVARSEIDDLFDGFVYGAMVGLGFATVENVGYFIQPVAATGGADQIGPVLQLYLLRVVFSGFYMHVLWTGLTGIGLAWYLTRRDQPRQKRLLVAAGLFAAGVISHFVWNSPLLTDLLRGDPGPVQMFLFGLFKGLPFLAFLGLLIVLAQRRERRWFEIATAGDIGSDVLRSDELPGLTDIRRRVAARRRLARTHGPAAAKLLGRLQRAQLDLAMVRTRSGDEQHPDLVAQRERIRTLRRELEAIPALPAPARVTPMASTPTTPTPSTPTTATAYTPTTSAAPATTPAAGTPQATGGPLSGMPQATAAMAPTGSVAGAIPSGATTASEVAPAPPPVVASVWAPTHRVPDGGMMAWSAPDPRLPAVVTLGGRLDLVLAEQAGDWARVVASNGWTGWVDARLLVRLST